MGNILSGIRVLDLTEFLAGPFTTLLLADLGAEVIKIEAPNSRAGGERARYSYAGKFSFGGDTVLFLALNRNKKSVVIDLKTEAGKELFYELVKKSDVVINNFSYSVPKRLGVDYETLKKINHKIIYCYLSTFGQTGPYKDRTGYDLIIQAMGGGMSITGEPGRAPVRAGIPIGDLGGALYSAIGILSAYINREKTGEGAVVDIGMFDCQISLLTHYALYPLLLGEKLGPVGTGSVRAGILGPNRVSEPLFRVYKTKDSYLALALASGGARFWDSFCKAIGHKDLMNDPRFNSVDKRWGSWRELTEILEELFLSKTTEEWLQMLYAERLPCSPVNSLDDVFADAQALHRNMIVDINLTPEQKIKATGNPIKIEGFSDTDFAAPPKLGEHTVQVLSEYLGHSQDKIEELKRSGIVA